MNLEASILLKWYSLVGCWGASWAAASAASSDLRLVTGPPPVEPLLFALFIDSVLTRFLATLPDSDTWLSDLFRFLPARAFEDSFDFFSTFYFAFLSFFFLGLTSASSLSEESAAAAFLEAINYLYAFLLLLKKL